MAAVILFTVSFCVYLKTLCPTIYWGDCGGLATDAYTLGIAHPTGYPVWVMLAHFWIHVIPFGSVIWRLNVLSAFFGALAVASLYGFVRAIVLPRPIALAVGGLFAFSATFWQQCLFCETYSLTAFYTCTLLFLAARWRTRGCHDADLRLLSLCYGLAMTNHQLNTLFLPGFVSFILLTDPTLRTLRDKTVRGRWGKTIGVGLLPLLSYAYIPIRARMHPLMNWGDPETWNSFLYHITGRQYAYAMFQLPRAYILSNLKLWAAGLGHELSWAIIGLAVLGLVLLWRRDRALAGLLSWMTFADVGYTINYGIYNRYIYYIPSYIALSALAGYACWIAWQRFAPLVTQERRSAFAAIAACCLLFLIPLQLMGHWQKTDLSQNWACYDYGRNLLSGLPPQTLLIVNGQDTSYMAMDYLRFVEGRRPDVIVVHRGLFTATDIHHTNASDIWHWREIVRLHPEFAQLCPDRHLSMFDLGTEQLLREVIANAVHAGRPVAVIEASEPPVIWDNPKKHELLLAYLNTQYETAQIGLPIYLYPKGKLPSYPALLAQDQRVWQGYTTRGVYDGLYLTDDFLTPIALDYSDGNLYRARLAMHVGDYADAAAAYQNVLHLFQSPEAQSGLLFCQAHLTQQKSAGIEQPNRSAKPVKIADVLALSKQP